MGGASHGLLLGGGGIAGAAVGLRGVEAEASAAYPPDALGVRRSTTSATSAVNAAAKPIGRAAEPNSACRPFSTRTPTNPAAATRQASNHAPQPVFACPSRF